MLSITKHCFYCVQVKGLSAMTKEALGLVPSPNKTVNGKSCDHLINNTIK